jgi:hypothetical protein
MCFPSKIIRNNIEVLVEMAFRRIGQFSIVSLAIFFSSSSLTAGTTEAVAALNRAEHFVLLRNWTAAEPFYATAEQQFSAAGDEENAMFARISRLRGQLPQIPLLKASHQLAALLEHAIVLRNPRVGLRCLAVKGDVDLDLDPEFASRDWTEAQSIANQLGDKIWANRAKGELAIIAFLSGNPFQAAQDMTDALRRAGKLGDLDSIARSKPTAFQAVSFEIPSPGLNPPPFRRSVLSGSLREWGDGRIPA